MGVRDRITQKFLEKLGFPNSVLIPDLVLSLPGENKPQNNPATTRNKVGFILASNNETFSKWRHPIVQFLVESCRCILAQGKDIVFIPFQIDVSSPKHKRHSEVALARELQSSLGNDKNVTILHQMLSPAESLRFIQDKILYIVSMRLHGCVFAARAGIPFVSLSYNIKQDGFLDLMAMSDWQVSLQEGLTDFVKFKCLINQIDRQYDGICLSIAQRREQLITQTLESFRVMAKKIPAVSKELRTQNEK